MGTKKLLQPGIDFQNTSLIGFNVSDSSLRHLVNDRRPMKMEVDVSPRWVKQETGAPAIRETWTYCTPGAAAQGQTTTYEVSTLREWPGAF